MITVYSDIVTSYPLQTWVKKYLDHTRFTRGQWPNSLVANLAQLPFLFFAIWINTKACFYLHAHTPMLMSCCQSDTQNIGKFWKLPVNQNSKNQEIRIWANNSQWSCGIPTRFCLQSLLCLWFKDTSLSVSCATSKTHVAVADMTPKTRQWLEHSVAIIHDSHGSWPWFCLVLTKLYKTAHFRLHLLLL